MSNQRRIAAFGILVVAAILSAACFRNLLMPSGSATLAFVGFTNMMDGRTAAKLSLNNGHPYPARYLTTTSSRSNGLWSLPFFSEMNEAAVIAGGESVLISVVRPRSGDAWRVHLICIEARSGKHRLLGRVEQGLTRRAPQLAAFLGPFDSGNQLYDSLTLEIEGAPNQDSTEQSSFELITPSLREGDTNRVFLRCKIHGSVLYGDGSVFVHGQRHHKF